VLAQGTAARSPLADDRSGEIGRPFFTCYSPKEYGGAGQSWTFAQDDRGVMYVGNNLGLLEYDGATWRMIPAGNFVVRSLAKDGQGRLYIGSTGEFGYLAADATGQMHYVSLLKEVKPEDRTFNDVWTTNVTPDGIYFQAREILIRLTPSTSGERWTVRTWKPTGRFLYGFFVRGAYYVHQQGVGLQRMVHDELQTIAGSEPFAEERAQVLLPYGDTDLLFGTFNHGLYRYDGRSFTPFTTEIDDLLKSQTLYKGITLPDGTLGLSTISGGAFILDPRSGRALRRLNLAIGLPADNGLAIFADRAGTLWLALEGAICQVETPSPLTRFDIRSNLSGSVADIVRHKGTLYVATGVGVFYLDPATSLFKQVTGFRAGNSQAVGLATNGDALMVGYGSGLHQVEGGVATLIKPNVGASFSAGALRFSAMDPRRLWVALEDGFASLRLDERGHWEDEGRVPGITATVGSLVESSPTELWLGTAGQGVIRVRFDGAPLQRPTVTRFGTADGVPTEAQTLVFKGPGGDAVVVTKRGVVRFDASRNRFVPDERWAAVSVGGTQDAAYLVEDRLGNVWANFGKETGVFRRQSDGSYRADKTALLRFADLAVAKIYPEQDGVVWFGRDDGLVRYDPSIAKDYAVPYRTLIRRVMVGESRAVYGGGSSGRVSPLDLGPGDNTLRFEYASTSYDDPRTTEYQSILEGFNEHWSAWSPDVKRDYTNLPPGRFVFRVKARNLYMNEGAEATYALSIAPPWYATLWARSLGVTALVFLIIGFVSLRTQKLKKESRRLERLVDDRTREIRDREAEVRAQAQELQTLDETVKAINREVGLRNVLHGLLEQGMKLFPNAEKGTFLIRDLHLDRFVFAAQQGYAEAQLKHITLSEEDVMQRYAEGTERVERGVYIVRPTKALAADDPLAHLDVPRSMLAMTVAIKGRLEGILVFDNMSDKEAFSSADVQRLTRFREHAVAAVTKARTLMAVQEKTDELQLQNQRLEQANENVELLSRIGRDITSKLTIVDIIETVYENVNALMDAAVFGIGIVNEELHRIEFPATKENGQTLPPFFYNLDDDSRLAVRCFKHKEEIVIGDFARERERWVTGRVAPVAGKSTASILYLPLVYKDKIIGEITAQSFRPHVYNEYHLNILRNLAAYTAIALDNADAYRRLNATLDRLRATQEQLVVQEKLASLGALTAGIAHEIKNPLNFVNNFAELSVELAEELQQELQAHRAALGEETFELLTALAEDLVRNARKINEHGRRADSIVKGMLLHSRGQTGDWQQTDLNALLEEYVNLSYHGMRAQDSSFNVTIERDYGSDVGIVRAVPQDLSRVFLNIVNNACYAANDKKRRLDAAGQGNGFAPTLRVSTRRDGDVVEVRIRDNGDGIPPEIRDRIFNPFFTTKPTGQGTGLGLSISHDIVVQQHDGTLDVETQPGAFTEFIIRLPVVTAAAA
jgi:signal transduction histidine kinase/ligand-binding sensor domain-containing protein